MATVEQVVGSNETDFTSDQVHAWVVCLSAALFFFYEFIQMNMFNSISPGLMRDFSVDAVHLGYLSTTYLCADVLFLLPAGLILDRVSTRKVIIYSMSMCILGTLGFALSHSVWLAGAFHFISGIGNAFCFLSCMMLAARWFPPRRQALVVGVIVTMAMTGGVVAQTPLAMLSSSFGWRHALVFDALLGVAIVALIWKFVFDFPPEAAARNEQIRAEVNELSFITSLCMALKNSQNWLYGIYTSLLNLPIMLLGAVWGDLYLTQVHSFTITQATLATSMLFIGTIVGSPTAGFISDHYGLRRMPMIAGGFLSLAVMMVLTYLPSISFDMAITLFFLLGFFTSTQVVTYPAIVESNSRAVTGTAMGLTSLLIMGGAAIAQPFYGYLMQVNWNSQYINNVPYYSAADFHHAMVMIPIAFVVGIAAVILARETHCKPFHSND